MTYKVALQFFRTAGVFMLWLSMGFAPVEENGVVQHLVVQPESTITIDGKTNVNKFRCAIDRYSGVDTLVLTVVDDARVVFTKGAVRIQASGFDCGMNAMTKDFVKTIKADKYPFIVIEFLSFEIVPEYSSSAEKFKGKLKLSLASVPKTVEVRFSLVKDDQGNVHLKGGHNFTFSDFNLEPPAKMMGLVQVDEKLKVNFHLVLKRI